MIILRGVLILGVCGCGFFVDFFSDTKGNDDKDNEEEEEEGWIDIGFEEWSNLAIQDHIGRN